SIINQKDIKESYQNKTNAQASNAVEILRTLVKSRYNPTQAFLNLNNINEDSIMINANIIAGFNTHLRKGSTRVGPVICKLIGEVCPEVQTITLDKNEITTLVQFSTLHTFAKHLVNLSIAENLIESYNDLRGIAGKEMKGLLELRLQGNPLEKSEKSIPTGGLRYQTNVRSHFPSLKVLDGITLPEEISFKIEAPSKDKLNLALSVKSSWIDTVDTAKTSKDFIEK
ncbi:nuclear mRNA export, poly(A)+RNA binding protein, partial [Nowakowskiella sp. JEL0078]